MFPPSAGPTLRRADYAGALLVFAAAFAAYYASAELVGSRGAPQHAYFNHLAAAFLEGRLDLPAPPGHHDLSPYRDRWYVPFPPLPALMLLPFVTTLGLHAVSTVLFSITLGAASAALVWLLLAALARRDWLRLEAPDRGWLTLMFALGTVHWQVALDGNVWFLGHVCTVFWMLLATLLAVTPGHPLPAGAALACAMLGRPNLLLLTPLLVGIAAMHLRRADNPERLDAPRLSRWAALSALPMAAVVAALMLYNAARFENPLDFGYTRQRVDADVMGDLHTYGQFSLHHLRRNVRTLLFGSAIWEPGAWLPRPDDRGMSILLTTPAFLAIAMARRRDFLTRHAWLALGLLLVPILLYYNTGWKQFGYRFQLDFVVPLLLLTAISLEPRMRWWFRGLILFGVLVNAWGVAHWFAKPA